MYSRPETKVLLELYIGVVLCSVVLFVVGIIFVKPRWLFALGILAGMLASCFQAYGMYDVLDRALDMESGRAKGFVSGKSLLRLILCMALMIVGILINWAMFVGVVFGLYSLKLSAMINPFIKKHMPDTLD